MKKLNQTKNHCGETALYRNGLAAFSIDNYACKHCLPAAQTHKLNALQVPGEDCDSHERTAAYFFSINAKVLFWTTNKPSKTFTLE